MSMHCPVQIARRTPLAAAVGLAWALALAAPVASARSATEPHGSQSAATPPNILLSDIAQGQGGFVIHGESPGDAAALNVSGAGDVNGHGIGGFVMNSTHDDHSAALSVAGAGDINGDGLADLIVNATSKCCDKLGVPLASSPSCAST